MNAMQVLTGMNKNNEQSTMNKAQWDGMGMDEGGNEVNIRPNSQLGDRANNSSLRSPKVRSPPER
jgi:hypothetical protein